MVLIIIGTLMIGLQLISILGSLKNGGFYFFSNIESFSQLLFDLMVFICYNLVGIIGIILLIIGIKRHKKVFWYCSCGTKNDIKKKTCYACFKINPNISNNNLYEHQTKNVTDIEDSTKNDRLMKNNEQTEVESDTILKKQSDLAKRIRYSLKYSTDEGMISYLRSIDNDNIKSILNTVPKEDIRSRIQELLKSYE